MIHGDTIQLTHPGINGERFALTLTDDATAYRWGETFQSKAGVFKALKRFILFFRTQTGRHIRVLRIDEGREFALRQLAALCSDKGINLQPSAPYHSE